MTKTQDNCSKCDCGMKRYIVNKKHYLCQEKNYERIHGCKNIKKPIKKFNGDSSKEDLSILKKKFSIRKISPQERYRCSDGSLVSQVQINRKYAECIDKIALDRPPICEGTGRGDLPVSFSHTISRVRCKQIGKTELIWDAENIEIESFHERSSNPFGAHNIWEDGSLEQKKGLINFSKKMSFIKKHDMELYKEKFNE